MIEFSHVSYAYPPGGSDALRDVSLVLAPGRRCAVLGTNGSGKSTLAKLATGARLASEGSVSVDGVDPASSLDEAFEVARRVGLVRQDPVDQIVSSVVFDEVAFGPTNLDLPADEVTSLVMSSLACCGLAGFEDRSTEELSGGELQRLALAGVVAMDPSYLVLDEVTAQLDGEATRLVREVVDRLVRRGCGILEITHDLEEVMLADEAVVLSDGAVVWRGTPRELLDDDEAIAAAGLADDALVGLVAAMSQRPGGTSPSCAAAALLAEPAVRDIVGTWVDSLRGGLVGSPEPALTLSSVTFAYGSRTALSDVSLAVRPGEVVLVAGRSGSGKSTMAHVLAGVAEPDRGSARIHGEKVRPGMVGLAFQRPADQLFCDTVIEDVEYGPKNLGLDQDSARSRAEDALGRLGVSRDLWERSPLALSGGQARRVALAGIVSLKPGAYVLDEPTAGLDSVGRRFLHELVGGLSATGVPVIIVSHDVGEWIPFVDLVAMVDDGRLVWTGPTAELISDPSVFERADLLPPRMVSLAHALVCHGADDASASSVRGADDA